MAIGATAKADPIKAAATSVAAKIRSLRVRFALNIGSLRLTAGRTCVAPYICSKPTTPHDCRLLQA
jgi:hypothetical protein